MNTALLDEVDTLAKAVAALDRGAITAVALTESLLERSVAAQPTLCSFLTLMEAEAISMARAADERRRAGATVTPLTGIPLAFKDIIDVANIRGTGHSRLYADRIAPRDATAVAMLRGAGAVFLGKVTTNEFAIGAHDATALAPNARNPWNAERTPGGSSSGSAVCVAAGLALGALGTDTGGSIRVPAAFNGIVGMKPSRGLVSRRGVMPLSDSTDHIGPMARTVEDAALLLDGIVSPETAAAAASLPAAGSFHAASALLPADAGYVRLRDFDDRLPPAHRRALDIAETLLQGLGIRRRTVEIEDIDELDAISAIIATCESWHYHRARLAANPDLYGRDAKLKLHLGALISGDDYLLAKARQAERVAAFEAIMGPADILLSPPTIGPAPPLAEPGTEVNFGRWARVDPNGFTNVLGGPAIALPCGSDGGLPLSVQLVSRAGSDAATIAIARALEAAIAASPAALPAWPMVH